MEEQLNGKTEPDRTRVQSGVIAAGLRDEILSGKRRPGERIGQESLATSYGTSRLPVREALRILESEGLVSIVSNAGARVARLKLAECVEIYRMREQLDPLLLSLAVPLYSDQDLDQLASLAQKISLSASIEDFLRSDREFHIASYRSAQSPVLFKTVERMWNTTQPYRRAYAHIVGDSGLGVSDMEHKLLVHSFRERDAKGAKRILRGHIRRTRISITSHPEIF